MSLVKKYPYAVETAIRVGEGSPTKWESQGIIPLSESWGHMLGPISSICLGGYNLEDRRVERVIGGICIYKSNGEFEKLPLSVLWEVLVVAMFSKKLQVGGLILVPIMEEAHNYPMYKDKYLKLFPLIEKFITQLGELFNVRMEAYYTNRLFTGEIDPKELYGLFHPYTDNQRLRLYPIGHSNEQNILMGYESYCLRYRYPKESISMTDLVIDGIHLSKSVITGIDKSAKYIPTLPIPSLNQEESCLLVDSVDVPTIFDIPSFENISELNELLKEVLGYQLEEILEVIKSQIN
ncbi:hypothetical protein [Bacillus mobilis]|uniref:hypothetical protein n=1 Tax=Bacillus mobilis TaxID=2026190 RepID=UPI003CF81765